MNFELKLQTGIIKLDVSDNFPIFFCDSNNDITLHPHEEVFQKRIINDEKINDLNKTKLDGINWNDVLKLTNPNECYNLYIY